MTTYLDTGCISSIAGATMGRHLRVKTDAGTPTQVVLAGASDAELGTLRAAATSGLPCTIVSRTKPGTELFVASGAIALGVTVFAAANGKVAASGSVSIGESRSTATTDGDLIQVLRK